MAAESVTMIDVASFREVSEKGVLVAQVGDHSIAVFADADAGTMHAVDNRRPHMGFPLHRGSVSDGILTCHWHEARFELSSGCTFDLFADDAITFATEVRDDRVLVATTPVLAYSAAYHRARLRRGMEHGVSLVQAKSLWSLLGEGGAPPIDEIVDFASANTDRFGEGMVRLTCVARLQPYLSDDALYLGMCYAVRQLSVEANSGPPRRPRGALAGGRVAGDTLQAWLAQWVRTRHRDAAERTLLTAVESEVDDRLAAMVFGAAGVRRYADGGHVLDACNKAFELTDMLAGQMRPKVFPLLSVALTSSRGGEESTAWHHPVEIVAEVDRARDRLAATLAAGAARAHPLQMDGEEEGALLEVLLSDDIVAVVEAIEDALRSGLPPADVADTVVYAAGMRLARFAPSNEVGDWFNPQHTFIFSNAVAQSVRRSQAPGVVGSIFDASVAVYLDRYLNVPPAKMPAVAVAVAAVAAVPADGANGRAGEPPDGHQLLAQFDRRDDGSGAVAAVHEYLEAATEQPHRRLGSLIDTLALATLREDLDFHSLQVLEAAATQTFERERASGAERVSARTERLFIGVARNLAAHCPTRRAGQQTAAIARRLQRGERIYEE